MTELLDSLEPQVHRLPNGLRVVAVPMPQVHRVVLAANLLVGSRYETPANNGISHFLEHMLFRGTPRHPTALAQALAFERLGGTLVAATGSDHGSLAIGVPPESFESVFDLFCEVYRAPTLDGIEIEKGIVREEINEGLDEQGANVDPDNLIRELTFPEHPLGMPITGTLERVDGFDDEGIARHHREFYRGGATTLAVAGPIDAESVFRLAEHHLAALTPGTRGEVEAPGAQTEARFRYVEHHASSQTDLRLAFRAPGRTDPDEAATEMLLRVLDDGMSTRLYDRICDAQGLCYDVSAGYEPFEDAGTFELAASAAHERAGRVVDTMFEVVDELRQSGPTDDEMVKARARHRWQLTMMLDDPGEVAELTAFGTLTGTAVRLAERHAELADVGRERVRAVAERVFDPTRRSLVAVGVQPRKARARLEAAALG